MLGRNGRHYRLAETMLVLPTARSSVHHTPYSVKVLAMSDRKAANMTDQPPLATPNVNVPPPPPQGGRFWMRWLLIGGGRCLSKEAATLDTASMTLADSDGRRSEAGPDKFGYVPDDRNIFLENLNPGVTDKGQAIFTVAPGSTGFEWSLATPTSSATSTAPSRWESENRSSVGEFTIRASEPGCP